MLESGHGHTEVVEQLLAKGADVNAKRNDGVTALIMASQQGHTEVVKQLLAKKGVDVNGKANNGATALSLARQNQRMDIVTILIAAGAKDNAMLQTPVQKTIKDKIALAENGGIDLNQINVNRTGKTVNVQFDPAQLNELMQGGFEGFTPVITGMTHISSPFQLLGIKEP